MSPRRRLAAHLLGLVCAVLAVSALYAAYKGAPDFLRWPRSPEFRAFLSDNGLGDWQRTIQRDVFGFLRDARLVVEVALAFVALSLANWWAGSILGRALIFAGAAGAVARYGFDVVLFGYQPAELIPGLPEAALALPWSETLIVGAAAFVVALAIGLLARPRAGAASG